ncbi:multicopper oxidase domain-containing protein [Rothia nasisuis]|uniref:multicopper oxidase domain-containing protein n=1 Tax=Rothia nasisuis TaxID=2109647 RepID=UPI001F02D480|nr:multicopper oxidase domain-containing protein [Rothia nasisuis]
MMSDKDAAPRSGYREQLTLGARPADAPGQAVSSKQARDVATGRASWHRKASKPVSFWMFALFIVLMTHRWIPQSLWLMVHMVTLGLITNSILIWSQHFTEALLKHRLPDSARPVQLVRIYSLNVSMILLMVGVVFNLFPLTLIGSTGVGAVVAWHGLALLQQMRASLPARFGVTIRYYVAAAWLLPVGATFGALLAYDALPALWYGRLLLAHEAVNVLGFVGITVVGTLLTLWPTMLRTVMVPDAVTRSVQALAGMGAGLGITTAGALTGLTWLATTGLLLYAVALVLVGVLMVRTTRTKKPADYPTLSVASGMIWLLTGVLWAAYLVATSDFNSLTLRPVTPVLVVGFLVQVLLGAMSYLLPARMGGGPKAVREATREFNRFAAGRIVMVNLSLLIFVLPVAVTGSLIRTLASLVGVFTLFAFIPLMLRGVKKSVAVRKAMIQARARGETPSPDPEAVNPTPVPHLKNALIGALAIALMLGLGLAADPAARARLTAPGTTTSASGQTTTLTVEATADMRFTPDTVEVPVGHRLIIEVTNTDTKNAHDLTFSNGTSTGRINPGESATVDAGVITENLSGWCSVVGHQAMGMTFTVTATGAQTSGSGATGSAHAGHTGNTGAASASGLLAPSDLDLQGEVSADYQTRDAALTPVPEGENVDGLTVHRQILDVQELPREIAPGVRLNAWTFNGSYMGPTLHGKVGDIFEITLVNKGSMGHSVDFHAGTVSPDGVMRTIAPGESLTYRFEAVRSGIWLYHCSTMPMSTHLGAGMFGAVIIDPPGLPEVDREYLLVQSEIALTTAPGATSEGPGSVATGPVASESGGSVLADVVAANQATAPTLTLFNGHATQYLRDPLTARVGERVRIWVLNAGPGGQLSFHVVGSQFDTVYKEGGYLLRDGADAFGQAGGGAQALDLSTAQGGFVEMTFEEAGTYTFVNHDFGAAERGARGQIRVSP